MESYFFALLLKMSSSYHLNWAANLQSTLSRYDIKTLVVENGVLKQHSGYVHQSVFVYIFPNTADSDNLVSVYIEPYLVLKPAQQRGSLKRPHE